VSWTRTNPGAGDPWGIRSQASIRQTGADNLRTTTLTNLQTAVTDAASATWTAQAASAFAASAEGLIPDVQVIITGLETDAGALNQYAAMVEQIQDQASAVQRQQDDAQRDLARLLFTSFGDTAETTSPWSEPDPNALERARVQEALRVTRSTLTQVEVRWDELALQRRAADDACVATLASVGSRGNLAGLGTQQLTTDGFIRLETGYLENGQVSSGQVKGHLAVWDRNSTAMNQLFNVMVEGEVELYAKPQMIVIPGSNQPYDTNPIMEPGYKPTLVDVEGGEK
jgi:hypothetical protein